VTRIRTIARIAGSQNLATDRQANVSIDEAARIWGVSRRTVERFLAARRVAAVKLGRRTLLRRADVERIAERGLP